MPKSRKKPRIQQEKEVYQVEVITKARVRTPDPDIPSGEPWWANYPGEDTWEPHSNVAGCQRLLSSFWDDVGTDDLDYPVGHVVEASKKWIEKEKQRFATDFKNQKYETKREADKAELRRMKKPRKKDSVRSKSPESAGWHKRTSEVITDNAPTAGQSDDDAPLSSLITKKRKRSPSESSSDEPLSMSRLKIKSNLSASTSKSEAGLKKKVKASALPTSTPSPAPGSLFTNSESPEPAMAPPPRPAPPQSSSVDSRRSVSTPSSGPRPSPLPLPVPKAIALPHARNKPISTTTTPVIPPKAPRLPNPHDKIAKNPSTLPATAGISTKQRLGMNALEPTAPKAVSGSKGRPPPLKMSSLPKFTKKSTADHAEKDKQPASASGMGPMRFTTPTRTPSSAAFSMPSPQGPPLSAGSGSGALRPKHDLHSTLASVNASPSTWSPVGSGFSRGITSPGYSSRASGPALESPPSFFDPFEERGNFVSPQPQELTPDVHMSEAENFLQAIMPSALAAPLKPAPPLPDILPPSIGVLSRKPTSTTQTSSIRPKGWTWTGDVTLHRHGSASPERLCKATLCDATEPLPEAMRFSVGLVGVQTLELPSLHDKPDLEIFLRACKAPQQIARLVQTEDDEPKGTLRTFSIYLAKTDKVVLVPIHLDGNVIAHILLFPPALTDLCQLLRVPPELQSPATTPLLAALLPWLVQPSHLAREWRKPPSSLVPATLPPLPPTAIVPDFKRGLRAKPLYYHALRILQFPPALHKYLTDLGQERPYCLWYEGGDSTARGDMGLETMLLDTVMKTFRAKNVGYNKPESPARMIFIHVGALKTARAIPGFADRRSKLEIQFYVYGSHESVDQGLWGVKEIWPCGGVVTMTADAVVERSLSVMGIVQKVVEHPLWTCYVHPIVLGMAVTLLAKGGDAIALLDQDKLPFQNILNAIEAGQLALLQCPPTDDHNPTPEKDARNEWVRTYFPIRPTTAREVLERCTHMFHAQYSNVPEKDWTAAVELEVAKDLWGMQRQEAIMKDYRRFVVLVSEQRQEVNKLGSEWLTPSAFSFGDDFFT